MPSSLVFAALVLAWLVVLVPVVARRRQMVPRPAEADLSARVLPRAAGAPVIEELPVTRQSRTRASGSTAVAERDHSYGHSGRRDLDRELDRELDPESYDDGRVDGYGSVEEDYDADAGYADAGYDEDGYDDDGYDRYDDGRDAGAERVPAPRSYRPGRGGFDPDAAVAAAESRYAFRRRVALGLIAVTVLSALAALVVSTALWWLHLLAAVSLVGYLVFLRRQTRIEEEVRVRRAARLSGERRALAARRERQAEHEERMAAVRRDADGYDDTDDADDTAGAHDADLDADLDGDLDADVDADEYVAPRWAAPRTPAPAVPDGMELVSDYDGDPAFHQLHGRESVPVYRRASGA